MEIVFNLNGDLSGSVRSEEPFRLKWHFSVLGPVIISPDILIELLDEGSNVVHASRLQDSTPIGWLPRGEYEIEWLASELPLSVGTYKIRSTVLEGYGAVRRKMMSSELAFRLDSPHDDGRRHRINSAIFLKGALGGVEVSELSWNKGHENWFFRHFDHAATTIISYMLGDHPLLRGRILDVGCGDGIISLGVALRCEPELMVGLDPFRLFEQLPRMMSDAGIPADAMPPNLRFDAADANHLPYEDDSFDVVISWGSLEHIAGGYLQALREIKRVLRPGGLFFVTPGLYYARQGSHLTEFCSEPYFHLTRTREEIGQIVRETPPDLMDRSGHIADAEQYLRWYDELNPITASGFENDLREHEFEPWRVAVRCEDRVDLTPALAKYPILDLAINDLYVSCWNRKPARPAGYRQRRPELPE